MQRMLWRLMGNYSRLSRAKLLEKGIQYFPKKYKVWLFLTHFQGEPGILLLFVIFAWGK